MSNDEKKIKEEKYKKQINAYKIEFMKKLNETKNDEQQKIYKIILKHI